MNNIIQIYFNWEGRIRRKTYWLYSIPLIILYGFTDFYIDSKSDILSTIIYLLIAYVSMMINIKRSHDRNRTGWFSLLLFIPIISLWPFIELGFFETENTDNRFGLPDNIWESNEEQKIK